MRSSGLPPGVRRRTGSAIGKRRYATPELARAQSPRPQPSYRPLLRAFAVWSLPMLGPAKPRRLDVPVAVSLEDLVPANHFYRHLEAKLDLSFGREWARELYAERG